MIIFAAILSFVLSLGVLYFIKIYLTKDKLNRGDTFFHLLLSESIRKRRWKYPSSLYNIVFVEIDKNYNYLAYPPLFHYIIALFPARFHIRIAKNFSVVVLSLISTLAAIFTYNLTSNIGLAVLSSFIVIFNYSAFDLATQSTPRALGLFFYSLIMCMVIFFPENPFSLIATIFLIALLSLTHKFAVQALVFGFLPYVFVFCKPYFLLSFAIGFLLSIIISRGFYLKILKEHVNWLRFYKGRPDRGRLTNKLITIFGRNFWVLQIVISIMIVTFQSNGSLNGSLIATDLATKLTFWSLVNISIALVVSVPTLSFLGEYYRYVEYSLVPVGILVSIFLASLNPYIIIVSVVCLSMSFLALLKFRKYLVQSRTLIDSDDIVSYRSLRDYGVNNLLVFPGNRTLEVGYYSRINIIHLVRGPKTPAEHVSNLINNYEINYALKFKEEDRYQLFETMTNITAMIKVADFKNFELYKIEEERGVDSD